MEKKERSNSKQKSKSKLSKEDIKKKNKSLIPVFRVKSKGVDSCVCKYIATIEDKEKLTDDFIEFPENKDADLYGGWSMKVCEMKGYDIFVKACSCNIMADYLLKNTKYPLFYVTMVYSNQLVSGQLFTLFLYFTIDDATAKSLKTPKHYINKLMTGEYTMELAGDDEFMDYFVSKHTPEITDKIMIEFLDDFEAGDDDEKDKINTLIDEQITMYFDEFKKLFEPVKITKPPSRSKLLMEMQKIFRGENMLLMAKYALQLREKERKDRMNPDQSFKAPNPKKILNLKEFRDHPEKLEEYLNNLSEEDSSDEESTDSD